MSFSARDVAAILVVGVVGVLIPGLQPQLLAALAAEGRLSISALGSLATVELLAMGVAAAGAGFVLPASRLRLIAAGALIVAACADIATPSLAPAALFAARVAAGLAEGVLVWIAIGFIIRTAHPDRWSGVYLMVQTLAQFAIASVLGAVAAGSFAGFGLLAAVTAAGLLFVPLVPAAYAPLERDPEASGRIPGRGVAALAGVLFYLAYIVAVWVYVEPLAAARGVPERLVHLIAPLSLAMQVIGAGAATVLAGRFPPRLTILSVAAINAALLWLMGAPPSSTVFIAATAAFGFLWLFAMPFQVPLVIAADPTRRAALLIGGAQLAGSSLGPLAAGMLVGERDLTPVLWFGAASLLVAVTLLLAASRRR
ncbi:MAG: hypothetical protein ACTHKM_04590 [Tsuneonella sp.]